ncbi:Rv3654c family TadE-like protein [Streptomyces fragilis]|uniref:Rv3654c family TadE-like protein n=1 Tax=Streptomyces fragilis TaxID=67301 RepID=A0ABV2YHR1_9ACTN|nr:Rv3654c family TadE-like protein [Streptomyces fragilis]
MRGLGVWGSRRVRRPGVNGRDDGGRGGRGRGDRGSATIWAGGILAALCVVFAAVLAMGEAVVVRHRAAAAADLAALAAARHWPDGTTAACAPADRVARAQRARLVRCEIAGEVADVVAEAGHGPFTAQSRARAGPSAPDPSPGWRTRPAWLRPTHRGRARPAQPRPARRPGTRPDRLTPPARPGCARLGPPAGDTPGSPAPPRPPGRRPGRPPTPDAR